MRRSLALLSLTVVVGVTGCAGSGGGEAVVGLQGRIDTTTFNIPAGETRTVTGDLTINATQDIVIEGTLAIPGNTKVTLVAANELIVRGEVKDSGATPPTGAANDVKEILFVGNSIEISGPVTAVSNLRMAVLTAPPGAPQDPPGTITISEKIEMKEGEKSPIRGRPGADAPLLDIGSAEAVLRAVEQGLQAAAPLDVDITQTGFLKGGRGGDGFTDRDGVANGRTKTFTSSNGGAGSNIVVTGNRVRLAGKIVAGMGGFGGKAGENLRAEDGKQSREKGFNVVATTGNGGKGGNITVTGTVTRVGNPLVARGSGGSGDKCQVGPGNGGPGGDGGDGTYTCGIGGLKGVSNIPVNELSTALDGKHSELLLVDAANGGPSEDTLIAGGKGGTIRARYVNGNAIDAMRLIVGEVANGGPGFNGCYVLPQVDGSAGGAGGSIDVGVDFDEQGSLNGGLGGDGKMTGGAGGGQGRLNGQPGGLPGGPGVMCHWTPETLVGQGWVAVRLNHPMGQFAAGDTIPLVRIRGGHASGVEANCADDHFHGFVNHVFARTKAEDFALQLAVNGADPEQTGCGWGKLVIVPTNVIETSAPYK